MGARTGYSVLNGVAITLLCLVGAMPLVLRLVPALASWALVLIETTLRVTGSSLREAAPQFKGDLYIHGVIALSQGFMLSSMVLAALLVHVIDRRFLQAAVWAAIAALLSFTGLIHAYELTATGVRNKFGLAAAPDFAAIYLCDGAFLLTLHFRSRALSVER